MRRITTALVHHRRPFGYWLAAYIIAMYIPVCAIAFVIWINPSLAGNTSQHIAADSSTYIYMADVLREHKDDPLVYAALAHFPNTLWMPVAIAYLLNSTVLTIFFNLGVLWLSLAVIQRAVNLELPYLLLLLMMNPTTVISLLSVNKEIIDLLVAAFFCGYLVRRSKWLLFSACLLALFNRYEVLVCFTAFLALESRLNPWRRRRWLSLALLLCGLSILLPLVASHALAAKFVEAEGGGVVTFLDQMEMHFLFFAAAVPKVAQNLFGELLNPSAISHYTLEDLANSYILLFNNVATAFVLVKLRMRGRLGVRSIRSDLMYLAAVSSLVMAISLVIQPRYFYIVYVLLCIEAVRKEPFHRWSPTASPMPVLAQA